jgi:hypothetical protein
MQSRDGRYFECSHRIGKGRPPLKTAGFFILVENVVAINVVAIMSLQ